MKEEKIYIFPENYNKKEKFLGVIDYKLVIVIGIIASIVFHTLKYVEFNIRLKISAFIVLVGFPSIFILIGINGENMVDFIKYIFKFFARPRVYVYRKTEEEDEKIYKRLVPHKRD